MQKGTHIFLRAGIVFISVIYCENSSSSIRAFSYKWVRYRPLCNSEQPATHNSDCESVRNVRQESCAIAKMTAQCALHICALKIFGTPWLRPQPLFPIFSEAFVPVDPMNVPTKFEVRSFTRCWDNRGYPKKWAVPGYAHAPFSEKKFNGLLFG